MATMLKRKEAIKLAKKLSPKGTKIVLLPRSAVGQGWYDPDSKTIVTAPDVGEIAHEAAHARQHKWLGPLLPGAYTVSNVGPVAAVGLNVARSFGKLKKLSPYIATKATVASQIPHLLLEGHAFTSAIKAGGETKNELPYLGSYIKPALMTSGLMAASDRLIKVANMKKYAQSHSPRWSPHQQELLDDVRNKLTITRQVPIHDTRAWSPPLSKATGNANVEGSLGGHGTWAPSVTVTPGQGGFSTMNLKPNQAPMTRLQRLGQFGKNAAAKAGQSTRAVGKAAASGAAGYTGYFVLKNILDSLQHTSAGRHLPDVKTDVEMIPTYDKKIRPLMYAVGASEASLVERIGTYMKNLKAMTPGALVALRTRISQLGSKVKSSVIRNMCMFWVGMITAELLGRGISGSINPKTNVMPAVVVNEKYALPLIAGAVASTAGRAAVGAGLRQQAPGFFRRNLGKWMPERRTMRKWGRRLNNVANVAMIGGVASQVGADVRAHRQMSEWDKNKQLTPPPAWDRAQGYQLTYGWGGEISGPLKKFVDRRFGRLTASARRLKMNERSREKLTTRLSREYETALSSPVRKKLAESHKRARQSGRRLGRDEVLKAAKGSVSPITPHVTVNPTPVTVVQERPHLTTRAKWGIGSAAAAAAAGTLETGRRMGKHEERSRVRRVVDAEVI